MQLQPRETFSIVRQIEDHTDTATYYVRAVVRNAKTDALIATVNLTDRGGQRFSANWQVPADGSGQGFWVSITTSVYTDSGYTTKSQNYGDNLETYLIQERPVFNPNYPIPVGSDINYEAIERIIAKVVKKALEEKMPSVVSEITDSVCQDVDEKMESLKPQEKPLTKEGYTSALEPLIGKNMTKVTDLIAVVDKNIKKVVNAIEENTETITTTTDAISKKLDEFSLAKDDHEKVASIAEDLGKKIDDASTKFATAVKRIMGMSVRRPMSVYVDDRINTEEKKVDERVKRLITK